MGRALSRLVPEGVFLSRRELDITERASVLDAVSAHRPEVIVNAAAYTKVDGAEADPDTAHAVNAGAVEHLAGAASAARALLVQPSTDYVFSGEKEGPYLEDDEPVPLSVYGKSKLGGERAAAAAERHLIVRTSWVFGEGSNFIRSILTAAQPRDELAVVDDQRGLPTYALDLARGLLDLVSAGARGIYHLTGSGESGTWAEVAEAALEAAGLETKVRRVTTAEYYAGKSGPIAPRPANSVLDCSKARTLGVELRPWRRAVAAYVKEIR